MKKKQDIIAAVLAAGGRGERLGGVGSVSKQFLPLANKPVYIWSLEALSTHAKISQVVVVCLAQMLDQVKQDIQKYFPAFVDKILVIEGGASRQDSVRLGLERLSAQTYQPEYVLVHDAARPFISSNDIDQIIEALTTCKGCTLAVPASDTCKRASGNVIIETIERNKLYMVQTPQAADFAILLEAHRQAEKYHWQVTDDITLLEKIGVPVKIVIGSRRNFKITNEDDLYLAEAVAAYSTYTALKR